MTSDRFHQLIQRLERPVKNASGDSPTVLVAGDVCLDRYVFGSVDRISPEAPVPVLFEEREEDRLGCMANVVVNIAAFSPALSIRQKVFGVVGADPAGEKITRELKKIGGECRLVQDRTRPTTVKTRYLAGSHHQLLRVDREKATALSADVEKTILEQLKTDLPGAKILVLQDYAKGFFSKSFLAEIKTLAQKSKLPLILDPNRNTPAESYENVTLITPNVAEAEALLDGRCLLSKGADTQKVEEACRELKKKLKLEMCLITRSAHGMTLLDKADRISHFPSAARSVFDVTGAGDTVIAALATALAHDLSPEDACWMATAAASVVVGKVGTATASISEIIPELHRMAQMSR